MHNGFVERFNRSYREDILDTYLFTSIEELRNLTWEFQLDYYLIVSRITLLTM
jgi:putative transposase